VYVKIITDVSTEPVSVAQAKEHMRITISDDDTYISILITAAREYCESYTRRALATQTLEYVLDQFPIKDSFELPMSPVQSITSIKYKDSDGDETTWDSANYILNDDYIPAKVQLAYNIDWPSFTEYPTAAVRVRYVAGHNDSYVALPKRIYQAILILVAEMYEKRELSCSDKAYEMPFSVKCLLDNYIIFGW